MVGVKGLKPGKRVKKAQENTPRDALRLDPEQRLCSQWDSTTIRMFPLASWDDMGFQVLDDFCHEHIQ